MYFWQTFFNLLKLPSFDSVLCDKGGKEMNPIMQ